MMKDNPLLLEILKHMHSRPCPVCSIYDIPTNPDKTIEYVEFDYDCSFRLKAFAWLCVDCESTDIRYFTEAPCSWKLNRKVRSLKLVVNTRLRREYLHTSVVYEEPEVWTTLAPNESYPLPNEPPEISGITFEGKTDAGTTSVIELFAYRDPFKSSTLTENPTFIPWNPLGGGPYPVEILDLKNTGSSTVYIRDLTTESVEGTPYAPGESISLPDFPQEIRSITFEAQTGTGAISQITLYIEGDPFSSEAITEILTSKNFDIGFTVPVEAVSLTNTGGSTVYFQNLTTSD